MHKWLSRAGLWSAVSEATRCNWCCIKQDEVSLFDTKSRCHRVSFVSNMSGQQPSVEAHLVHCLLSSVSRHVRSVSVLSAVPDCMQDCRLVQRAEGRGTSPLLSIFYPSQPWHRWRASSLSFLDNTKQTNKQKTFKQLWLLFSYMCVSSSVSWYQYLTWQGPS